MSEERIIDILSKHGVAFRSMEEIMCDLTHVLTAPSGREYKREKQAVICCKIRVAARRQIEDDLVDELEVELGKMVILEVAYGVRVRTNEVVDDQ